MGSLDGCLAILGMYETHRRELKNGIAMVQIHVELPGGGVQVRHHPAATE